MNYNSPQVQICFSFTNDLLIIFIYKLIDILSLTSLLYILGTIILIVYFMHLNKILNPVIETKEKTNDENRRDNPINIVAFLVQTHFIKNTYLFVTSTSSVLDAVTLSTMINISNNYPKNIPIDGQMFAGTGIRPPAEAGECNSVNQLPISHVKVKLRNTVGSRALFNSLNESRGFHTQGESILFDSIKNELTVKIVDIKRL